MITSLLVFSALVAQTAATLSSAVSPRIVADFAGYSEGIVFDAQGTGYVSLPRHHVVYLVPAKGSPVRWYSVPEPNGHKILKDGSHLVAARGGIHHVTAEGHLLRVFASTIPAPNDLALDGDGGFYVSAPASDPKAQQARRSGVYYLGTNRTPLRVADGHCFPNGIVVTADGRTLLVNDSCTRQILAYDIAAPGQLRNRRVFARLQDVGSVPDGMTLDQGGRLWVADHGSGVVAVFGVKGDLLRRYETGMQRPSNVAFGGSALSDLYVTGASGAYEGAGRLVKLPVEVPGRDSRAMPASIAGRKGALP